MRSKRKLGAGLMLERRQRHAREHLQGYVVTEHSVRALFNDSNGRLVEVTAVGRHPLCEDRTGQGAPGAPRPFRKANGARG